MSSGERFSQSIRSISSDCAPEYNIEEKDGFGFEDLNTGGGAEDPESEELGRAEGLRARDGGGGGGGALCAGEIPSSANLLFAMGVLEYLSRVSWNFVTLAFLTCDALSLMDATLWCKR